MPSPRRSGGASCSASPTNADGYATCAGCSPISPGATSPACPRRSSAIMNAGCWPPGTVSTCCERPLAGPGDARPRRRRSRDRTLSWRRHRRPADDRRRSDGAAARRPALTKRRHRAIASLRRQRASSVADSGKMTPGSAGPPSRQRTLSAQWIDNESSSSWDCVPGTRRRRVELPHTGRRFRSFRLPADGPSRPAAVNGHNTTGGQTT